METFEASLGVPEWEEMPRFIRHKIELAAAYVEGYDDASMLPKLNKFLNQKGLIGKKALVRTGKMIAVAEVRSEDAILFESVFDADILGGSQFEGEFVGCGAIELEDVGTYATYNLQFEDDNDRIITIKALINASTINFQTKEPEANEMDNSIAEAFEQLSRTDVAIYHEVVTCLREAFSDKKLRDGTPIQKAARLRTIGAMSTFLMAHPEHFDDPLKVEALNTIIGKSIDDSCQYTLTGRELRCYVDGEGNDKMDIAGIPVPMSVDIVAFRYIPSFEIEVTSEGKEIVIVHPGQQPAFIAFDIERNRQVELPLQYIMTIDEISPYEQPIAGFQTCGDQIRAYEKRQALGHAASGSFLNRFQ